MQLATSDGTPNSDQETTNEIPVDAEKPPENTDSSGSQWAELERFDVGTQVMVERLEPEYAEGHLASVMLDSAGPPALIEKIKSLHGGGTFRLQPRARAANGRRLFAKGSITIKICGFPIVDGRAVGPNGPLETPATQQVAPAPLPPQYPYAHPPMPPVQDNSQLQLQSELMGLVGAAIKKGDTNVDLAGVIGSLAQLGITAPAAQQQPAPRTVDPYSDVRKTVELVQLLQEFGGAERTEKAEPESKFSKMLELGMMKMLMGGSDLGGMFSGANQAQQQQQPQVKRRAPAPPPASTVQHGPATAQPSPNHVWHPAKGWILFTGASEVPPVSAEPPPAAEPSSQEVAGGPFQPSPDEYVPPIEPEELIGELEAKDQPARVEFIGKIIAGIGNQPELQQAMMTAMSDLQEAPDAPEGTSDE